MKLDYMHIQNAAVPNCQMLLLAIKIRFQHGTSILTEKPPMFNNHLLPSKLQNVLLFFRAAFPGKGR